MWGEGQDTQHLSAFGYVRGRLFLWVPITLICYLDLVLHLKVYSILTCSSTLSKQAILTGMCHGKGNDITNHKTVQEPFPWHSHSGPLEIILHLFVTPFFILRDFCEKPSVRGFECTRSLVIAHRSFDSLSWVHHESWLLQPTLNYSRQCSSWQQLLLTAAWCFSSLPPNCTIIRETYSSETDPLIKRMPLTSLPQQTHSCHTASS